MSAISNAKWIAVSQVARLLSQVANIVILARFLSPSDYGLMGMAMVVTNLALLLRDMGTAAAIIQIKEITDEIISSVFWLNVVIGLVVLLTIVSTSTFVAAYFKEPKLIPVLCALAFIFPILSVSSVQKALIERNSRFRDVAISEVLASILSMSFAIAAALIGLGVYSFVVQALSAALFSSIYIWFACDWSPKLKPTFSKVKEILPFSSHMTGSQILIYCTRNLDSIIIGRMLGAGSLGFYSVASKIMLLPIQNISWIASRALYPVMSRQQDNLVEMSNTYLRTISFISFITAPLMMGIFVLREPLVVQGLGLKWISVGQILTYLAPVGYLQSIIGICSTVMMAQGRTKVLMWFSLFTGTVITISFIVGANYGVRGVALGYLVASIIGAIPTLYFSNKLIQVGFINWFKAIFSSIFISIIMGLIIRTIYRSFSEYFDQNIFALCIIILFGVVIYTILSYIFIPEQVNSIIKHLRKSKNK